MRIARHAIQHVIGRRGAIMLAAAVLDFAYAGGMLTATPAAITANSTWRWFDSIAPLDLLAVAWLAAGTLCAVYAFRREDQVGYAAAWLIKATWALIALFGWAAGELPVSAPGVWVFAAAVIGILAGWAEPDYSGEDTVHDDRTT